MPTIADYTIISENRVTLPKDNGDIDHEFSFTAPAANAGSRSILAFRVNPSPEDVTVQMTLNGTEILTQTFNSDPNDPGTRLSRPIFCRPTTTGSL
jgi:hypothetical protein